MYKPQQILSKNSKCTVSLDLPLKGHCRPTPNCAHDCYARCGRQSLPDAKRKHDWVSKYLAKGNISSLIIEAKHFKAIRLNGSGDLNNNHIPTILYLAASCPNTMFWGMTRKPEIASKINNILPNLKLILSVDASSPKSVWNYTGKMCWGPKRPGDLIPNDPRIIISFPRHVSGRVVKGLSKTSLDCKAVWHDIQGCHQCKRCWTW